MGDERKYPKSPNEEVGGMRYFARMLDKIRLRAEGELSEDYHANLGKHQGADGVCSNFLRVNYDDLRQRVVQGGSDEEILKWCYSKDAGLTTAICWCGTGSFPN